MESQQTVWNSSKCSITIPGKAITVPGKENHNFQANQSQFQAKQ